MLVTRYVFRAYDIFFEPLPSHINIICLPPDGPSFFEPRHAFTSLAFHRLHSPLFFTMFH